MRKIIAFCLLFFFSAGPALAADPYFHKQWYLSAINAEEAWQITKGSASVVVAIIDTGVDLEHRDLKANLWKNYREVPNNGKDDDGNGFVDDYDGWNFVENNANPAPRVTSNYVTGAVDHGTFIAGLVSAVHNNGYDISGVTAQARIMPIRALGSNGEGNGSTVAKAVRYAVDNGAHILNLSFAGDSNTTALKESIIYAYERGVLVVAAAGNSANGNGKDLSNAPLYPICFDKDWSENRILGVAASNKDRKLASFSNYGAGCIDITAPGEDMASLAYHNQDKGFDSYMEDDWIGSSFSAGLVVGVAALMKSVNFSLNPSQMIDLIKKNSSTLFVNESKYQGRVGDGIVNAAAAVRAALSGGIPGNAAPVVTPAVPSSPTIPTTDPNQSVTPPVTPTPVLPVLTSAQVFAAGQADRNGRVTVFNSRWEKQYEINIFGDTVKSVNLQTADYDGDGKVEIIAGAGKGSEPRIKIIGADNLARANFLAFDAKFRGGVVATACDLENDGEYEIVAAAASGAKPEIKIFGFDGKLKKSFVAYTENYANGLQLACGDIDGDLKDDIVVAPNAGLFPKVKMFAADGSMKKNFFPYPAQFMGGVKLALGDVNGDKKMDIITGAGPGGGPHVRAFDYAGNVLLSFMAYDAKFRGGVSVGAGDWNGDGRADIITGPGMGGGPHARIWDGATGAVLGQLFPFEKTYTKGINVGLR